jgi:hypothetical protein
MLQLFFSFQLLIENRFFSYSLHLTRISTIADTTPLQQRHNDEVL